MVRGGCRGRERNLYHVRTKPDGLIRLSRISSRADETANDTIDNQMRVTEGCVREDLMYLLVERNQLG